MTFLEIEKKFVEKLIKIYDTEEAKSLFLIAAKHICKLNQVEILLKKQEGPSLDHEILLMNILKELITNKPIQYILGETVFYGLKLNVNSSVLIPRPETEELIDWTLREIKNNQLNHEDKIRILDIGTGSGCIAIALTKNVSQAEVVAIDISQEALQIANINATLNKTKIEFIQADILSPFVIQAPYFHIIISNPPYITIAEQEQMHQNVLDYEPHTALFVPNNDPLIYYQQIAKTAKNILTPDGLLFFEINEKYSQKVIKLLKNNGYKDIVLRKDMMGKSRMIKAKLY